MFKNFIKISLRNLKRDKTYSIINIVGLAIGISAFLLISIYVNFEKSFDNYQKNIRQLYRIENDRIYSEITDKSAACPPGIGPELKNLFPEIIESAKVYQASGATVVYSPTQNNGNVETETNKVILKQDRIYYAESSLLRIFTYTKLEGDGVKALSEPNHAVITKSTAEKYFGHDDAIGKQLLVKNSYGNQPVEIAAVYDDSPQNTHLKFELLISFPTLVNIDEKAGEGYLWGWNAFNTYVKLAPSTDVKLLNRKIDDYVAANEKDNEGYKRVLKLQPVKDIHLNSDLRWEFEPNGNSSTVLFLSVISFFILIITWTNYTNITTAKLLDRANEVGIRKVLGSNKRNLVLQFLTESLILNTISMLTAIGITKLVLPLFSTLIGKSLPSSLLLVDLPKILIIISASAVLTGIYPAFLLASFNPLNMIKGKFSQTISSGKIRRVLIACQFCLTIILISGSLIVFEQVSFMKGTNLGIDIDQIVVINSPVKNNNISVFRDKVLELSSVQKGSISASVPTRGFSNVASQIRAAKSKPEEGTRCQFIDIDQYYFDLYNVPIIAGVNFSATSKWNRDIIINETACKTFGFKSPEKAIGEDIILGGFDGQRVKIIGVVKDYHHESLQRAILPIIYNPLDWVNYYSFKVKAANISKTISDIHSIWKDVFSNEPFEYFFLDELFNNKYKTEEKFGEFISIFTSLAIFILCLGLFGVVAYNIEKRRKEIGIRKVIGASNYSIIKLIGKEFANSILISLLISIPITIYLMNKWLDNFAYRIDIGINPFIISCFIAFSFTFTIVFALGFKAAIANPVESLKYE